MMTNEMMLCIMFVLVVGVIFVALTWMFVNMIKLIVEEINYKKHDKAMLEYWKNNCA